MIPVVAVGVAGWLAAAIGVGLLVGRVAKNRDRQVPTPPAHVVRPEQLERRQLRARCSCRWRGPIRRERGDALGDAVLHVAVEKENASA